MSKPLKAARYLFRAMLGAYALGLILFLGLHFLVGESWFVVGFLKTFAQFFLLPSLLRINYLFYSEGIRPVSAEVLADRWGSDHHPILLSLVITP